MSKQFGAWESVQLRQVLERFNAPVMAPALALPEGAPILERPEPVISLSAQEQEERARIISVLDTQNWRRQDTAAVLGISRKVLWEKMRKFNIKAQDATSRV
jgi:transcriptional regulator of acetoin/glycerol metabolism